MQMFQSQDLLLISSIFFMPNGPRTEEETPQTRSASESDNVFTNSAESAAEELQRQRDRLNGEEL